MQEQRCAHGLQHYILHADISLTISKAILIGSPKKTYF